MSRKGGSWDFIKLNILRDSHTRKRRYQSQPAKSVAMLEVNQAVTGGQVWHSPTWIISAMAWLLISSESDVRKESKNLPSS